MDENDLLLDISILRARALATALSRTRHDTRRDTTHPITHQGVSPLALSPSRGATLAHVLGFA